MPESIYPNLLNKRVFLLSIRTINFCKNNRGTFPSLILFNQLIRSVTSIGANVVEAKAASSRADFKRFQHIALKSANESLYWLALIKGVKVGSKEDIDPLLKETKEIANMLAASVIRLKNLP